MSQKKHDRRTQRTRAVLENALLGLIRRKRYEAITSQDICAAADVGRSTFYAHYRSKDDLKRHGLDHLRCELAEAQSRAAPGARLTFSLPMFEHARAHLEDYRALKRSRGGKVVLERIREIVSERVRSELATHGIGGPKMDLGVMREYLVGAYLAVLTWWLDDGARIAPRAVDSMFRRLAGPAFEGGIASAAES